MTVRMYVWLCREPKQYGTYPFSPEVAYVGSHMYDAVHIWRIQIVRVYITYYIGYAACKCDMLYT